MKASKQMFYVEDGQLKRKEVIKVWGYSDYDIPPMGIYVTCDINAKDNIKSFSDLKQNHIFEIDDKLIDESLKECIFILCLDALNYGYEEDRFEFLTYNEFIEYGKRLEK